MPLFFSAGTAAFSTMSGSGSSCDSSRSFVAEGADVVLWFLQRFHYERSAKALAERRRGGVIQSLG